MHKTEHLVLHGLMETIKGKNVKPLIIAASPIGLFLMKRLMWLITAKCFFFCVCDITTEMFPAGVHVWMERGRPGGRPHAHKKSLFWCHLPQQPRHPVRLSRHEGQPAVALQKGKAEESVHRCQSPNCKHIISVRQTLFSEHFVLSLPSSFCTKQQSSKHNCYKINYFKTT